MIENMTFGSGAGSLPEGTYYGEFVAVDKTENKFQPGKGALRWDWKVTQGEFVGKCAGPNCDRTCCQINAVRISRSRRAFCRILENFGERAFVEGA